MKGFQKYNSIDEEKSVFYKKIYTNLSDAMQILDDRQKNHQLINKIENLLRNDIPQPLVKIAKNGVIFRQVATPNYEIRWYIDLTTTNNLNTIFFEYHNDKFTSNNIYKHSLGQLVIHKDQLNKNGEHIEEKITVVDFAKYDGQKLKDILLVSGESLIAFHKSLFDLYFDNNKNFIFYDASPWLKSYGEKAIDFYANFILLFICHGILFENFLFNGEESEFTRKILIPAFEKAEKLAGLKPLIVPIPPMDKEIEEDIHWHSYDPKVKLLIKKYL